MASPTPAGSSLTCTGPRKGHEVGGQLERGGDPWEGTRGRWEGQDRGGTHQG
jgi:hypothetical protein